MLSVFYNVIIKVPLYMYVYTYILYCASCLHTFIRSVELLSAHVCTYEWQCIQYSVGASRDRWTSGENCSEVGAILLPFHCNRWRLLDVTNSTLSAISAVLAISPAFTVWCTIPVHLYLHTCTVLSTHQCTTPDCGVFFASRTVDFGRYQCWTPRSRGKSVFYSLRQCSPDNEPGMYVTICMECGWHWCAVNICCVYSVWTLNTKGVAVWYVLVRNPVSTSVIQ